MFETFFILLGKARSKQNDIIRQTAVQEKNLG